LSVIISFCDYTIEMDDMTNRLFLEFETLSAIISATPSRLSQIEGMTDRLSAFIRFLHVFQLKVLESGIPDRIVISNSAALKDFLVVKMRNLIVEEIHALFIDNGFKLLCVDIIGRGSTDHVAGYPVEIVKRAIQVGAVGVILVHNHPSRSPAPSRHDLEFTRSVIASCLPLGIKVHDHVIIAGNEYISMRETGLMHGGMLVPNSDQADVFTPVNRNVLHLAEDNWALS
jgi:DNA repair protein RadC